VLVLSTDESSGDIRFCSRREEGDVSVAWTNCSQFIDTSVSALDRPVSNPSADM
jgi:hypothetical protein